MRKSEAAIERHREVNRIYMRGYAQRNKERIAVYEKEYRGKNRDHLAAYKKVWGEDNVERLREYWKARHKATYVPSPKGPIVTGRGKPNVKKAACSPTDRDLAWAAGFLEGEGSFTNHGGQNVSAAQVQREPLDRLLEMFGGSFGVEKPPTNPNHQQVYRWRVTGARARGVMMTMFVFMSPNRKEQIINALHRPCSRQRKKEIQL